MSVPDRGRIRARRLIATAAALADSLVRGRGDPVDIDPALRTSVRANGAEPLAVGDERAKESDRHECYLAEGSAKDVDGETRPRGGKPPVVAGGFRRPSGERRRSQGEGRFLTFGPFECEGLGTVTVLSPDAQTGWTSTGEDVVALSYNGTFTGLIGGVALATPVIGASAETARGPLVDRPLDVNWRFAPGVKVKLQTKGPIEVGRDWW